MIRPLKRVAASLLAALVVFGAPGLRSYDAAAQVFRAAPGAEAGSVRVALPVAAPSLAPSALTSPSLSLLAPSISAFAPAAAPALAAAAPVAAAPAALAAAVAAAPAPATIAPLALAPAVAPLAAAVAGEAPRFTAALAALAERVGPLPAPNAPADAEASQSSRFFDLAAARYGAADVLPILGAPQDVEAAPKAESGLAPASAPATPPSGAKTKIPRSMWGLFWGHHILTVFGIEFHGVSQPFLVMDTLKKSKAVMGMVRNVHMGSMSIVNLLPVGLLIDKTDFRTLFIATSLARAVLMGAIPLLFLAGHLSFAVLVGIVALNPVFQSTMIVADGAARMAFLGTDEKLNKEASATLSKWDSLAGMIMPVAASFGVAALVGSFGLGGYAVAYAVYAGLLLAAVPVYWLMVRDPRDHSEMGMAGFVAFMKGTVSFLWALAKGLVLSPLALARFAGGLFKHRPAAAKEAGLPLKERVARVLDGHDATTGFAYILRNKTLATLMGVGAVEAFLSDAMPMVVLPNFIKDVIGTGPHLGIPMIGGILATAGGIFGLMLAAESVGRFLASWRMEGEKGDRLIEKLGHGRFYKMAGVSSLLFWLMWLVPTVLAPHLFWINLGAVMFVQFAMQIFHGPVGIVMAPVVRNEIPDDKLGRVESAFGMVDMFFSAGGALLAGFLLDLFPISTAMAIIAAAITLTGVIEWKVPGWIFPDGRHPAKKSSPPPAA